MLLGYVKENPGQTPTSLRGVEEERVKYKILIDWRSHRASQNR